MLTWLSRFLQYVSNSLCPLKFVTAACVPLSPLILPAAAAWLGFLFCSTMLHRWKLLILLFWKECASMRLPESLSGDLGGQSPKMWFRTSFGPRLHLVRTSLKLQPVKTQPGEVLGRLCHAAGASSSKWRRITPRLGSEMLCTTYLALGVPLGNR